MHLATLNLSNMMFSST